MDIVLLAIIVFGLLVALLLIVYLVDRVNALERDTQAVVSQLAKGSAEGVPVGPFGGLSGKKLWDALAGRPPEDWDEAVVEDVRLRYEVVLYKHIESLFEEGRADGASGLEGTPKNPRKIQTLRGKVDSWLPSAQVNAIYRCGLDAAQSSPDQRPAIGQQLDETALQLFQMLSLEMRQSPAAMLLATNPALSSDNADAMALPLATPVEVEAPSVRRDTGSPL